MYWELFGWFAVDQGDEWDEVWCGLRSVLFEGGPAGDHERAWAGSMKPLVVDEEEGASMVPAGLQTGDGGWTSAYRTATMDFSVGGSLPPLGRSFDLCPREKRRPSTENQLNSCHPYCGPLWKKETPETAC